jgi:succinate-semialdehyde dehydrogenase/glutarate-semialdehyde dehydrogenase
MACQSINPYNGKLLKTFKELTEPQLEKAIKTAAACFENWRHTPFAERAAVAAKAAAILRERVDEFARPMTLEMGKRIDEARDEVAAGITAILAS